MLEIAIGTDNAVIPALGVGISFKVNDEVPARVLRSVPHRLFTTALLASSEENCSS